MLKKSQESIRPDGLQFKEIVSQSNTLLVAGSETTASALSDILYYLLINPKALAYLKEEIHTAFSRKGEINIQRVNHLPYLQAMIKESLHIYPPIPNILPRTTPHPGEVICGKYVPRDTSIRLYHYACYHSSKNFFKLSSFVPERWLNNNDSRFAYDDKNAFHPFSYGPRNCLGKK